MTRVSDREKDKTTVTRIEGFRPTHILVHYDELVLKGRNRGHFEKRLLSNVRTALKDAGDLRAHRIYGRILVELGGDADVDVCARRLKRVFGITRYSPVVRLSVDLEEIKRSLEKWLPGLAPRHFAISCRRTNKDLPFRSMDVNRELGTYVQNLTGWPVRIKDPDLTIHVHLIQDAAWVGFDRLRGEGGLPTGCTGKVVSLLSGGIDSPVATHQIMRRGSDVVCLHFHSFPHTGSASQDKVREIIQRLLPYGHRARLYMTPFAETQQRIIMECPPPLRVVLYRRFMLRAAEAVARQEGALATVTGDSLGQVASQTLENLHAINRVAEMPVLRPLIGLNKLQIVDHARRIDTYDISIEPHDDCCSYLMPRNPATRSTPEDLERAEEPLDTKSEVAGLLAASTMEEVTGKDQ